MEKLTEQKDRSCWNIVQIDGVPKTSRKIWEKCKEEIMKIMKNKLDFTDDIDIDRCYCMGKFQRNKSKHSCL